MVPQVAKQVSKVTEEGAQRACWRNAPLIGYAHIGYPPNLNLSGVAVVDAISGILPDPFYGIGPLNLSSLMEEVGRHIADTMFVSTLLWERLREQPPEIVSGGDRIASPLAAMALVEDRFLEPGTMLMVNTRHLHGRDFDPRFHAVIRNVKPDASDPDSSSPLPKPSE